MARCSPPSGPLWAQRTERCYASPAEGVGKRLSLSAPVLPSSRLFFPRISAERQTTSVCRANRRRAAESYEKEMEVIVSMCLILCKQPAISKCPGLTAVCCLRR